MNAIYIFGGICAMATIVQIISLVRFGITKSSKCWELFVGIAVGVFISSIAAIIVASNAPLKLNLNLNDGLASKFVCFASLIVATVLSFIGWAVKKFTGVENTNFTGIGAFTSITLIAVNLIILLLVPAIIK